MKGHEIKKNYKEMQDNRKLCLSSIVLYFQLNKIRMKAGIINISSQRSASILQFIEKIIRYADKQKQLAFLSQQPMHSALLH